MTAESQTSGVIRESHCKVVAWKTLPMVTNTDATIEDAVFSMWSTPWLYNDQQRS
jgi:hypothetical protein